MYFMLTLVVFLAVGGHHAMLHGVRASFDALPLLSRRRSTSRCSTLLIGLFQAATALAMRLAAPMLVTMLVVDLALGLHRQDDAADERDAGRPDRCGRWSGWSC